MPLSGVQFMKLPLPRSAVREVVWSSSALLPSERLHRVYSQSLLVFDMPTKVKPLPP